MAGAFVAGYQGETIDGTPTSPYLKVAATAKHFALNNNENDRHADSADASESDIRDYYTAQFRSLVEDSHVAGLMTSYNAINGTPSPADTYTTDALAQRTWGFDGYITSDCGAVGDVTASSSHNWAPPGWTVSVVERHQHVDEHRHRRPGAGRCGRRRPTRCAPEPTPTAPAATPRSATSRPRSRRGSSARA